jgi:two-component sensor histidine kinase
LTQDINETNTITLNHNQTFFTLELSGLDFASAAQMRYAYRLVGIHTDWIDNGFQNTLAFNNIAPGDYILEVKTQGTNGVWSAIKTLKIHVLPPFWRRTWFIGLCVALFLLGIYKLYTFRINQLKHVHIVQNSIAADLHDDIGSSLSHIEILSFLSQKQLDSEQSEGKAKELMVKISEEVKKTNESLHQLVWTMHAENDGFEPTMTKLNRMAIEILEPQDIRLSFSLPQQAIPTFEFGRERQRDLIMVYKEAITNISKHAEATAVHIIIDIKKDVLAMLSIDIEDNGIGCETKRNTSSFGGNGLKNMHQRMLKHGGSCVVHAKENGKGTVVTIRLPIYPPN